MLRTGSKQIKEEQPADAALHQQGDPAHPLSKKDEDLQRIYGSGVGVGKKKRLPNLGSLKQQASSALASTGIIRGTSNSLALNPIASKKKQNLAALQHNKQARANDVSSAKGNSDNS